MEFYRCSSTNNILRVYLRYRPDAVQHSTGSLRSVFYLLAGNQKVRKLVLNGQDFGGSEGFYEMVQLWLERKNMMLEKEKNSLEELHLWEANITSANNIKTANDISTNMTGGSINAARKNTANNSQNNTIDSSEKNQQFRSVKDDTVNNLVDSTDANNNAGVEPKQLTLV